MFAYSLFYLWKSLLLPCRVLFGHSQAKILCNFLNVMFVLWCCISVRVLESVVYNPYQCHPPCSRVVFNAQSILSFSNASTPTFTQARTSSHSLEVISLVQKHSSLPDSSVCLSCCRSVWVEWAIISSCQCVLFAVDRVVDCSECRRVDGNGQSHQIRRGLPKTRNLRKTPRSDGWR